MTSEEFLKAGITAARGRDFEKASKLLAQVVQTDPNSELGWFWLGVCRTAPEQREYCFRQVLAINPQNVDAKRQIEILRQSSIKPQAVMPLESPKSSPSTHAAPFIEQPENRPSVNQKPSQPRQAEKPSPKKQRKKDITIWVWAGAGLAALICIGIVAFIVLTKISPIQNVLSPVIPQTAIPTVTVTATPIPNYKPIFEPGPCNFKIPDQANVTCGFIIVPEDRTGNVTDTIKLAVAIYHGTGNTPKPDPILYLQGGPGDEAISWSVAVYPSVISPLLADRDFIVFDPRGVGYSQPTLDCDDVKETYLSDLQDKIPDDQRASYYEGALLTCKNDLLKRGVNLSTYTSREMAADTRDVVLALGYQEANLYGISYGTRIAQLVMRDHPEVVRSAILDSVVPIETQMFDQDSNGQNQVLRTLFEDCKASSACSFAYPDLESVYGEVVNQLDAQPFKVTISINGGDNIEQTVDGSTFSNLITWMLRTSQTIGVVPQMIYRIHEGDNSILLLSAAIPLYAFDSISVGTYISVNCRDQVFPMSIEKLDKTIKEMCQLWEVEAPLPGENEPVISEIPSLIFAGRYDPVTPISLADQLAAHLMHSHVIVIPNQGHAPTATGISDCPTKLILSFLQDPNSSPDVTCVAENSSIKFIVPFDPNAPLSFDPVEIEQYHISTQVPSGWSAAEFGFYNRNGSFGDIAQIGIQSAAVSESEWTTWLATNFRGGQGFDQPVVKHDERSANNLTWSIYRTTSKGHPVEMAFAKSGNETLMILTISYEEEHDALYNAVFLPIIDSTKSSK